MVAENLAARFFAPTISSDANQPLRSGNLTDTCKRAFQQELMQFFQEQNTLQTLYTGEMPTIQRFAIPSSPGDVPAETIVRVLLQHPDIRETLPLVAITSAVGRHEREGIGTQLMAQMRPSARVQATNVGPFTMAPGDKIAFRTVPLGSPGFITTLPFQAPLFSGLPTVTAAEIIAASRALFLYITVSQALYTAPVGALRFDARGHLVKPGVPNIIEVLGPPYSTQNALDQLGLTAGQSDTTENHLPINRYETVLNLTVNLDIGTEDENTRRALTDLLLYFFSQAMDIRHNTFFGRSVFDDQFPDELFQIILLDQQALSGEAEIPRPGASDGRDKLYVNRMSVPVKMISYFDRTIVVPPTSGEDIHLQRATNNAVLPSGDFQTKGRTSG